MEILKHCPRSGNGLQLRTGESFRIFITDEKLELRRIEVPDIVFNRASAVACLDGKAELIRSLSLAWCYAASSPGEEMLVVGHADTSGEPRVTYPLSEFRAQGVLAILAGDEAAWLKTVNYKSTVDDYQRVFKSLSGLYYWDCDPGEVDGKDGPATRKAVQGFQREANSIFNLGLRVDGIMGPQTWRGVLRVYRKLLEQCGLGLGPAWKPAHSGRGVYACGESFPIGPAGDSNLVSQEHRRVEIYFGKAGAIKPLAPPPSPDINLTPRECVLFDPKVCTIVPLGLKSTLHVLHTDPEGAILPGVAARLFDASGAQVQEDRVTDAHGFVHWFDLDEGEFEVEFEGANS